MSSLEKADAGKGQLLRQRHGRDSAQNLETGTGLRTNFKTRQQAETAIGLYVDGFHNPRRRHSALGCNNPIQFESGPLEPAA